MKAVLAFLSFMEYRGLVLLEGFYYGSCYKQLPKRAGPPYCSALVIGGCIAYLTHLPVLYQTRCWPWCRGSIHCRLGGTEMKKFLNKVRRLTEGKPSKEADGMSVSDNSDHPLPPIQDGPGVDEEPEQDEKLSGERSDSEMPPPAPGVTNRKRTPIVNNPDGEGPLGVYLRHMCYCRTLFTSMTCIWSRRRQTRHYETPFALISDAYLGFCEYLRGIMI